MGRKMGRAEAIQTGVADMQRYHQARRNSGGEGGGAVKELRAMESCKKQKNRNRLCLFLHSNNVDLKNQKIIAEIIENHSEFDVCANSCNKFVSSRS